MAKDKILHFGAGFIIAVVVTFFTNPLWGVVIGFIAGASKEVYDRELCKTGFSFKDMFATFLGATLGVMVLQFIRIYIL